MNVILLNFELRMLYYWLNRVCNKHFFEKKKERKARLSLFYYLYHCSTDPQK